MEANAAAAAEQNLLAAVGTWAAVAEEGQLDEIDGCTFVRCAVPLRSFNQVLVQRSPADLAAVVASTRQYFRGSRGVFRLRIRDDVEPVADEPLLAAGLERHGGIPCLSAAVSPAGSPASSIEIRPVSDETTLAHHVDIVHAAFELWRPDLARVFRPALIDAAGWRAYVGYLQGQPVTTAQLVTADGTAGLYWVATVEGARGRGFGEAITRHAMAEAATLGCSLVALQASSMGQPMYERIGFTQASYYRSFVARR